MISARRLCGTLDNSNEPVDAPHTLQDKRGCLEFVLDSLFS